MRLPEVRGRLLAIADEMAKQGIGDHAAEIRRLAAETKRRPAIKRATARSRRMTPRLRQELRAAAVAHPHLSNRQIGAMFDVDGGRVSEALAGFRS